MKGAVKGAGYNHSGLSQNNCIRPRFPIYIKSERISKHHPAAINGVVIYKDLIIRITGAVKLRTSPGKTAGHSFDIMIYN